jgi:hypothetical protein
VPVVTVAVKPTEGLKEYELAVLIAPEATPTESFEKPVVVEKKNVDAPPVQQQLESGQAAAPSSEKSGACALIPGASSPTSGWLMLILLMGLGGVRQYAVSRR